MMSHCALLEIHNPVIGMLKTQINFLIEDTFYKPFYLLPCLYQRVLILDSHPAECRRLNYDPYFTLCIDISYLFKSLFAYLEDNSLYERREHEFKLLRIKFIAPSFFQHYQLDYIEIGDIFLILHQLILHSTLSKIDMNGIICTLKSEQAKL